MKPKALVFYTYLPPWRIDVFNEMGEYYDLTIIFLNPDSKGFTYNRELLIKKLNAECIFLTKGINFKSKSFRFGIITLIKKYKPVVVFSHEYSPTSVLIASCIKFKFITTKYIITTSDNLSMAESVHGFKKIARRFVLKYSDGIIVYSEIVKNWYNKQFPYLKVEVCPNIQNPKSLLNHLHDFSGITANYRNKYGLQDSKVILYIGRLTHVKGLDLLIEAFSRINKQEFKLILVGEGEQKEKLQKLVTVLNINDKVIFPGYFDDKMLYAWYSLANFFVLPSRFEPFGAVVNEALVYGCPVLASKYIGALDYIQEDYNGLIFDPLDEKEFVITLNNAMSIFYNYNVEKKNLMIQTFEDFVNVFEKIVK